MNKCVGIGLLGLLVLVAGCKGGRDGPDPKPAQAAAEGWMALLDEGRYEETWETASAHFKTKVSKDVWAKLLERSRPALGAVQSRELESIQYQPVLTGAPDGDHFSLRFRTRFERRPGATESLFVTREEDGTWRVLAYYPPD